MTDVQLREIAVGNGGGVASVHVDGFEQLMPIFIGVAEAAALVYATTGGEGRRPSTLGTWRRSLEVEPCCNPQSPLSPPCPFCCHYSETNLKHPCGGPATMYASSSI